MDTTQRVTYDYDSKSASWLLCQLLAGNQTVFNDLGIERHICEQLGSPRKVEPVKWTAEMEAALAKIHKL